MLVPTRRMLALRAVAYPSHRACRAQPAWVAATRRLCTADAPLQPPSPPPPLTRTSREPPLGISDLTRARAFLGYAATSTHPESYR